MRTTACIIALLLFSISQVSAQRALPFEVAEKEGLTTKHLDSLYQGAVDVDTTKAVFKTEEAEDQWLKAYQKMLVDFGDFLYNHQYKWKKSTRIFNKIYFNRDGSIDYFLYHFSGEPSDRPSEEEQVVYGKLLQEFIQTYRVPVSAPVCFTQCGPVRYEP